ncbi:MAG: hypothetical protein ACHQRO_14165 [Vicinamibacteria bacterium]
MRFGTLLHATALAVACAAQAHGQPVPRTDVPGPIVPPRIELGGGGGASGTSPDIGLLASLPLGDRLSFDVGASYLARVWYSQAFGLGQAQLRIPFRARLRSRYSLLVGATYLEAIDAREGDSPLWQEGLHPHAGASMQWPMGRGIDLRVDAQLVVQFDEIIPVAPRAVAAFVWHAEPPRSLRATGGTP